MYRNKIIIL